MAAFDVNLLRRDSPLFADVQTLWRRNSATLGFLPAGAFDEAAAKGWLLGATTDDQLAGYLLFRVTNRRQAAIAHLCVAEAFRGQGIARMLFDALRARIGDCTDIIVTCRRDFEVSKLWPHLNFTWTGDKPAKREGARLATFRYTAAPLPLFAGGVGKEEDGIRLVLDANVFFDLDEQDDEELASKALLADWLANFVDLCLTEETLNEIGRQRKDTERERQLRRARLFTVLPTIAADDEAVLGEVRRILRTGDSESDRSDARQLAKAIAAQAPYFVTRDGRILDAADDLYEGFGIEVLRPHEVILRLDELRRANEYRPRRSFIGPDGTVEMVSLELLDEVEQLLPSHGPDRRARRAELAQLIAQPATSPVTCVRVSGRTLAAFALMRTDADVLSVPFLVAASDDLGPTAARHLVEHFVDLAATEGRRLIEVSPSNPVAEAALSRAGYLRVPDRSWIRVALAGIGTSVSLRAEAASASASRDAIGVVDELMRSILLAESQEAAREMERALWPAKALGTGLPCFVVPIEPKWAAELFDYDLARQTLFGADAKLILNWENAYYRASHPPVLDAPARVLWYVSANPKYQGAMAIRACSRIEEVVAEPPKAAFRRFRRLGVYRWKDVFAVAKGDLDRPVQAFRFTGTECFGTPVGLREVQTLLEGLGMGRQQFQSPLRISEEAFFEIYRRGHGGARGAA